MKKLYTHENRLIIYNLKNLLGEAGINGVVMNEYAGGGAGDLATFDTWPELWVEDDSQMSRARKILDDVLNSNQENDWFCRNCQEKNSLSFEICWNCGQSSE